MSAPGGRSETRTHHVTATRLELDPSLPPSRQEVPPAAALYLVSEGNWAFESLLPATAGGGARTHRVRRLQGALPQRVGRDAAPKVKLSDTLNSTLRVSALLLFVLRS